MVKALWGPEKHLQNTYVQHLTSISFLNGLLYELRNTLDIISCGSRYGCFLIIHTRSSNARFLGTNLKKNRVPIQ